MGAQPMVVPAHVGALNGALSVAGRALVPTCSGRGRACAALRQTSVKALGRSRPLRSGQGKFAYTQPATSRRVGISRRAAFRDRRSYR